MPTRRCSTQASPRVPSPRGRTATARFWDPFQRTLREEIDPAYDGDALAGYPLCAPGTVDCDADYDLASRPAEVKTALERISLTGRIGKPLLELQGTLDTAVTPRDSRLYSTMIRSQRRGALSRLYEVEGGSHFEGLYGQLPNLLRPMLPCFQDAFGALEEWTSDGEKPPASHAGDPRRVHRPGEHLRPLTCTTPWRGRTTALAAGVRRPPQTRSPP